MVTPQTSCSVSAVPGQTPPGCGCEQVGAAPCVPAAPPCAEARGERQRAAGLALTSPDRFCCSESLPGLEATVPGRAPPAGAAALLSAPLHGVWELDVTGARCVFMGRRAAAAAGRQAPRAPIMAPVLRQESPRSFRWHAKGSWRRKLASRFRGKRRRIRIKEWKNPPTGEKQEYF